NGGGSTRFGGRGPGGGGGLVIRGGGGGGGGAAAGAMRQRMQDRFNQQFAEFRGSLTPEQQTLWDSEVAALLNARRAPLYKLVKGKPEMVVVRVGASDGNWTEVSGNIQAGDEVIVGSGRNAK
ncbi:MAG: efflux RND transporter periplasmic adaptor subunit, partial [Lysobacter sp.]|nr:efflux RND transporter periplasmic adaptor subunit [Lysobacter sp.]